MISDIADFATIGQFVLQYGGPVAKWCGITLLSLSPLFGVLWIRRASAPREIDRKVESIWRSRM